MWYFGMFWKDVARCHCQILHYLPLFVVFASSMVYQLYQWMLLNFMQWQKTGVEKSVYRTSCLHFCSKKNPLVSDLVLFMIRFNTFNSYQHGIIVLPLSKTKSTINSFSALCPCFLFFRHISNSDKKYDYPAQWREWHDCLYINLNSYDANS